MSAGIAVRAIDGLEVSIYREWAPPASLRSWLKCVWVRDTPEEHAETVPVLPDACTDLMYLDGSLQIAGPDTAVNPACRPAGGRIVGIRFHPGSLASLVTPDLVELANRRVTLADVWPGDVPHLNARADEAAGRSVQDVARFLLGEIAGRIAVAGQPDRVVTAAVAACLETRGPVHVRTLAADLHVSERQLRRRSKRALGYGLKTLDRILRFQRFLRVAEQAPAGGLASVAAAVGYADQSHLTRECQRLAGLSPATLLADRAM